MSERRENIARAIAGNLSGSPLTDREWFEVFDDVARGIYREAADAAIAADDGAIGRVLALHRSIDGHAGTTTPADYCAEDGFIWPCPTVRAVGAPATAEDGERCEYCVNGHEPDDDGRETGEDCRACGGSRIIR